MNVENSRKAIQAAYDFYKSIVMGNKVESMRLEGIEMVDKNYKITLSYAEEGGYIFADQSKRHYNVFTIDEKFNLISMGMEKDCE